MKKNIFFKFLRTFFRYIGIDLYKKVKVHERGYWCGKSAVFLHQIDEGLLSALVVFFKNEKTTSLVDFGCGTGYYVRAFLKHRILCEGYDGNPDTKKISKGLAQVLDLSKPFDLGKKFDWVLSLEVGEHIPREYEKFFIENLDRHAIQGIILSWATKGQGGFGHYNEQDNQYIKNILLQYGYLNDQFMEEKIRQETILPWYKNTLMVFRRKSFKQEDKHDRTAKK